MSPGKDGPIPDSTLNESEKLSWLYFTQNTTIHGVKHIFERSAYIWRRILWSTIVVISVGWFVVEVGLRIDSYYDYGTNTEINVHQTDSLDFPVVTVCNLNVYRISQIKKFQMYGYLQDFYGNSKNKSTADAERLLEDLNLNTSSFMKTTTHQLKDLMEKCTWLDVNCEIDNAFIESRTKDGTTCYSFRPQVGVVTQSGLRGELSFYMNVETYEHMIGPNKDSGIQVMLSAKDKSSGSTIIVTPGKHYRVSLTKTSSYRLPPPYGYCSKDTEISTSSCMLACAKKHIRELCNCTIPDYRMEEFEKNGFLVCNMSALFGCFLIGQQSGISTDTNSSKSLPLSTCESRCATPCDKTVHELDVSSADLSKYNVEEVVFDGNKTKVKLMHQKFLTAIEARHRLVKDIFAHDTLLVNDLFKYHNESVHHVKEADFLFRRGKAKLSIFERGADSLAGKVGDESDILENKFKNLLVDLFTFIDKLKSSAEDVMTLETKLELNQRGGSDLLNKLMKCEVNKSSLIDHFTRTFSNDMNFESSGGVSFKVFAPMDVSFDVENLTELQSQLQSRDWVASSQLLEPDLSSPMQPPSQKRKKRGLIGLPVLSNSSSSPTSPSFSSISSDSGLGVLPLPLPPGPILPSEMNSTGTRELSPPDLSDQPAVGGGSRANSDTQECETTIYNAHFHFYRKSEKEKLLSAFKIIGAALDKYEDLMSGIIKNETDAQSRIPEHPVCIETLEQLHGGMVRYRTSLESAFEKPDTILGLKEKVSIIHDFSQSTYFTSLVAATDKLPVCFWIFQYMSIDEMITHLGSMTTAENDLDTMTQYRAEIDKLLHWIETFLLSSFANLIDESQAFLEVEGTKYPLASLMTSKQFQYNVNAFQGKMYEYEQVVNDIESLYNKAKFGVTDAMDNIHSGSVSILNISSLLGKSVNGAAFTENQNGVFTSSFNSLSEMQVRTIEEVMDETLGAAVESIAVSLSGALSGLSTAIDNAIVPMEKFMTETNLNEERLMENFVQVDIHYGDMSYTEVKQTPSYEFGGLLGDVGGFMGLLLGASIMTVCELLDYIGMRVIHWWMKRRVNNKINSQKASLDNSINAGNA